jgi:tRNA threonylcarbamoyladenosine biosynthesis protein TsaB
MILAIDTSSSAGSISLFDETKIHYQIYTDLSVNHSETIMFRIDEALKNVKADKKDLQAVFVTNGPGSFTGIRIGLATAKGLCIGLRIPIFYTDTLTLLAMNLYGTERKILALLDARMKEAYTAVFNPDMTFDKSIATIPYKNINSNFLEKYICVGHTHLLTTSDRFQLALPHQNSITASAMFSLWKSRSYELLYDEETIKNLQPMYFREAK